MARPLILLAVLVALSSFLFERRHIITITLYNWPGKLQTVYGFESHEVVLKDKSRNCEDVVLVEDVGVAILSCDPGRDNWNTVLGTFSNSSQNGALYIYSYSQPHLPASQLLKHITFKNFPDTSFHPLGIEFDPDGDILYVVNHAASGSVIETFELNIHAARAVHVRTTRHPLVHTPNSIQNLGGGRLLFTNDHYIPARTSPVLSKAETCLGIPGGSVAFIDTNDPNNTAKTLAHVPFANGITMLNDSTVVVASTTKPGLYFYSLTDPFSASSSSPITTTPSLRFQSVLHLPGMVDNLSVDPEGNIFMAGHPHGLSLLKVAARREKCNSTSEIEEERKACECHTPSWVAKWSEKEGLRVLYQGSEYGSSSTAVKDSARGVGLVVGLYERGVLVFR